MSNLYELNLKALEDKDIDLCLDYKEIKWLEMQFLKKSKRQSELGTDKKIIKRYIEIAYRMRLLLELI